MNTTPCRMLTFLSIWVLVGCGSDWGEAAERHDRATVYSEPTSATASGATPTDRARVEVIDGRVTIHAVNAALGGILKDLARKSGVELSSHDALAEHVTLDVDHRPFDEALAMLLRDRSYALRRAGSAESSDHGAVATLYVFSALNTDSAHESPDSVESIERLGVAALTDTNPSVRYQAVDALAEIGEERVITFLQQALTDPEADVREAAIDALGYIGGDESASALAVALNDESSVLREEAVAALGNVGGPIAAALLQQAANDGIHSAVEILGASE